MKWEEIGGEGGSVEGGEGGSIVSRRKSSEFQRKLAVFEQNQKTEDPDAITFSNLNWKHSNYASVSESKSKTLGTHRMRGGSLLAEKTTNAKRGCEYELDISCRTKKLRQNQNPGGGDGIV